jgi:aminoglycoside phosphotransferase (APT) family kinase protein
VTPLDGPGDGRAGITAAVVRRLIVDQAPQWAALPIHPVLVDGWDNRTYRLGPELTVRLPTHERYVPAVAKESEWLAVLAPHLPVPIPEHLFTGKPGRGYPFPWSVRRWLPGRTVHLDALFNPVDFAREIGEFLVALHHVNPARGPLAGEHSFHRGASPSFYDDETRQCLADLADTIDVARATAVWNDAIATTLDARPRWFHGDFAVGNLLINDGGTLAAVIDFGTCGVGDPACDLVIAWTLLSGESRRAFAKTVNENADVWARARGWALWKALLGVRDNQQSADSPRRVIDEVLADAIG